MPAIRRAREWPEPAAFARWFGLAAAAVAVVAVMARAPEYRATASLTVSHPWPAPDGAPVPVTRASPAGARVLLASRALAREVADSLRLRLPAEGPRGAPRAAAAEATVSMVQSRLEVGPADTAASVLTVSFTHPDSVLARAVPDLAAAALIRRNAEASRASVQRAVALFDREIEQASRVAAAQEEALRYLIRKRLVREREMDTRISLLKSPGWEGAAADTEYQRLLREQIGTAVTMSQLKERRQEAVVSATAQESSIRVLDRAAGLTQVDRRGGFVRVCWAIFAGIGLGLVVALAQLKRAGRVAVAAVLPPVVDLETLIGAPVVATVPLGPLTWRASLPDSFASVFQGLAATVPFGPPRVLVVTSARAGEGKTMVASMLARVLARRGRRVLLIDAETRRGDVHAVFGIPASPGFFDAMYGESSLAGAIQTVRLSDAETFDILPSGGVANDAAADLLIGGIVAPFLARLRARYDYVVVDTPPLDLYSDAALIAAHADATVLVVRDELIDEETIENAVKRLARAKAPLTGVVRVSRAAARMERAVTA